MTDLRYTIFARRTLCWRANIVCDRSTIALILHNYNNSNYYYNENYIHPDDVEYTGLPRLPTTASTYAKESVLTLFSEQNVQKRVRRVPDLLFERNSLGRKRKKRTKRYHHPCVGHLSVRIIKKANKSSKCNMEKSTTSTRRCFVIKYWWRKSEEDLNKQRKKHKLLYGR